jgi:hypothetical protein
MDDLQSTAEMIPIPVVLQVLDQEDALSDDLLKE